MFSIIYSDQFLQHKTGSFHPERPERLTAIVDALRSVAWKNQLNWQQPTPISQRNVMPYVRRLHTDSYLSGLENLAASGGGHLDMDTPVSPQSYDIAMLAVSAWLDGIDQVLGNQEPAFVLARPPGHHAVRERGMGFCLLSNAAIAAYYALEQPEVNKIAIVDWDVHHGNGTEALVEDNAQIAYCSLHQSPCYPGTGAAGDRGCFNNVLNLPMPPESNMSDYQPAFETKVMPFLRAFDPDLLIVSAGYDANKADQLANMALIPPNYGVFTQYLLQLSRRIVFGLEGGYDLPALSQSVVATVEACIEQI